MRREPPRAVPLGPAERAYAANYRSRRRAQGYLSKYQGKLTKRWSTNREIGILGGFLARAAALAGPLDDLLDLPSGPGRLLAAHVAIPRRLVFGDIGEGMVRLALENAPDVCDQVRAGVLANGIELPFKDRSFDGVVSIRLAHHLEGPERFERYLRELLRVSRGAVILTFFSSGSLKNRIRNVSVRLGRRLPKKSVDPDAARRIAESEGFDWEAAEPLSRTGSGHLYVLLLRREARGKLKDHVLSGSTGLASSLKKAGVAVLPAIDGAGRGMVAKRYPAAFSGRGLHRGGGARALGEWKALLALRADGAPVARALAAWGDEGIAGPGWLVTEEVAGARTLKEIAGPAGKREEVVPAVREALSALAALHAAGWVLGDTFAKNILVRIRGGRTEIRFIDQPRARKGRIAREVTGPQLGDLARLYKGVRGVIGRDRFEAELAGYLAERKGDARAAADLAVRAEALAERLANETPLTAFVDAAKRKIRRLLR